MPAGVAGSSEAEGGAMGGETGGHHTPAAPAAPADAAAAASAPPYAPAAPPEPHSWRPAAGAAPPRAGRAGGCRCHWIPPAPAAPRRRWWVLQAAAGWRWATGGAPAAPQHPHPCSGCRCCASASGGVAAKAESGQVGAAAQVGPPHPGPPPTPRVSTHLHQQHPQAGVHRGGGAPAWRCLVVQQRCQCRHPCKVAQGPQYRRVQRGGRRDLGVQLVQGQGAERGDFAALPKAAALPQFELANAPAGARAPGGGRAAGGSHAAPPALWHPERPGPTAPGCQPQSTAPAPPGCQRRLPPAALKGRICSGGAAPPGLPWLWGVRTSWLGRWPERES